MKNVRATRVQQQTREFLEATSPNELRRLLDTPVFSGTVLKHAAESKRLSQNVDAVLDREFQEMPPERQHRIMDLTKRIRAKIYEA